MKLTFKELTRITTSVIAVFLTIISCVCKGQDTIVKVNGDEIIAKIILVDFDKIQFKKFNNLNGPTYNLFLKEVSKIKYENGTMDFFRNIKTEQMIINDSIAMTPHDIIEKQGWDYYYKEDKISIPRLKKVIEMHTTPETFKHFNTGYQCYIAGMVIGFIGIDLALSGVLLYTLKMQNGMYYIYSGIGMVLLGIPVYSIGLARIDKSVNRYNRSVKTAFNPKLSVGINNSGLGLMLKF